MDTRPTVAVGDDVAMLYSVAADGTTTVVDVVTHPAAPDTAKTAGSPDEPRPATDCDVAAAIPGGR